MLTIKLPQPVALPNTPHHRHQIGVTVVDMIRSQLWCFDQQPSMLERIIAKLDDIENNTRWVYRAPTSNMASYTADRIAMEDMFTSTQLNKLYTSKCDKLRWSFELLCSVSRGFDTTYVVRRLSELMYDVYASTAAWSAMVGPSIRFATEWRTTTVVQLARKAYDDRDTDVLPILADALEDAGAPGELLGSLRTGRVKLRTDWWVWNVIHPTNEARDFRSCYQR